MLRESVFFILFSILFIPVYAQMGVGTDMPDPAAELEVKSNNRGLLIPRISLTSTTDETTITAGNVESLLVYNTSSNENLSPGFYYWYNNMWKRLSDENNLPDNVVIWDEENNQFTYIDSAGESHEIDLDFTETLTSIVNNEDGTISYFDEDGEETIVSLTSSENIHITEIDYEIATTDRIIIGKAETHNITITLPNPVDFKGEKITIKKEDFNEDYFVQVNGNIAGLNTNEQLYTAIPTTGWEFISDGTYWRIINKF